ncbi:uncharacterized protein LTR77_010127 [Saxophila tyrrhenica]|uniref:Uncharacterized protein n=1 Tax=Saxophila tyrrhenica TaxID=1690608 RepID=A0AAV9NWY0_9PEZI|nr:hypothetical protein LTR77_010127 [Saxophila tyrrhenica]
MRLVLETEGHDEAYQQRRLQSLQSMIEGVEQALQDDGGEDGDEDAGAGAQQNVVQESNGAGGENIHANTLVPKPPGVGGERSDVFTHAQEGAARAQASRHPRTASALW